MLYNLKDSVPLNFNEVELYKDCMISSDYLVLTYLSLHYGQEVPKYQTLIKRLKLGAYPSIEYDKFTAKDIKSDTLISSYTFTNKISRLAYTDILYDDIEDYERIQYLRLVSKVPPYCANKFIPRDLYNSVPSSLTVRGLIKPVAGGIVLLKERGE
jgi:hypothetical protein